VIGVEPVVSLRDVCGLSPQATEDALAWTARTITEAAVAPWPPGPKPPCDESAATVTDLD
jgi:hypothetical protein